MKSSRILMFLTMVEATEIQIKLLSLFRHDPNRRFSFASIKAITTGLAAQHFKNGTITALQAPYRFFMPLLRMGLIEFAGKGMYQLSPTALLHRGCDFALMNCSETLANEVSKIATDIVADAFGVLRFKLEEKMMLDGIIQEQNVHYSMPDVLGHLQNMKRLREIILDWEEYLPTDTRAFQSFIGVQGWKPFRNPTPGSIVGYSNPGGQKYIVDGRGAFRRIPSVKEHPDAFNIAVCASRSIQGCAMVVDHDQIQKQITLRDQFFFPIILDRLLRIHNIFDHIAGMASSENEICTYDASATLAGQINRILN